MNYWIMSFFKCQFPLKIFDFHPDVIRFLLIQYKNFTKTRYLRLYLQTTGLHNKDVDPGKQERMTIPKGHYMEH